MAVVNGPLHSGQASGALGGLSYSEDQYGHTCKSNIYPNDPRSTAASQERALVNQFCAFQFANLSLLDFAKWINYSETHEWKNRLGQSTKLNPQQWYMKFCIPAKLYFGIDGVIDPPQNEERFLPIINLEWTVNGVLMSFDQNPTDEQCIVVWQTRNLLATQVQARVHKRSQVITSPTTSPVLITGGIGDLEDPPGFPYLTDNTFINIKIVTYTLTGLPSPELRFRINVVS